MSTRPLTMTNVRFPVKILPVKLAAFGLLLLALACERAELLGTVGGATGPGGAGGAGGEASVPGLVVPLADATARDTDPTFTADRLELYFMSLRSGNKELWKSVRSTSVETWGAPTLVEELSSGYQEENPRVSPDGLRLWYFTDRDRALGTIWESSRATRDEPWGAPVPLTALAVGLAGSNVSACPDDTGTLAALSARPLGSAGYDLYFFERDTPDDDFGPPTLINEVNSASDDFDPYLSPNGLALAFSSNRFGSFDILLARRTSTSVPFEAPTSMDINTREFTESAPAFSPDLAYMMYSSTALGSDDIYEAVLFP